MTIAEATTSLIVQEVINAKQNLLVLAKVASTCGHDRIVDAALSCLTTLDEACLEQAAKGRTRETVQC